MCYIFLHPNYFSILVLIRWTHFALGVLQQRRVGSHIVPVVYAVTRPASLYFMWLGASDRSLAVSRRFQVLSLSGGAGLLPRLLCLSHRSERRQPGLLAGHLYEDVPPGSLR